MKKGKCIGRGFGVSIRGMGIVGIVVGVALVVLYFLGLPQDANAIGAFIDAPGRVDMVYDDVRDILYITSGGRVLRYQIGSNSFLSPLQLGGNLKGIDLSPDSNILIVADQSYNASEVWVHRVDPETGQGEKVFFPRAFMEAGTFMVAFGNNGTVLITSSFLGSGWVPMRRYNPVTQEVTEIASVQQDSMLKASADGSMIGFAESNISDGRFGRYRVADGDLLRKTGYTDGTGWFNYEVAVNAEGTQYAIPTYGGTFICDANLVKYATLGQYAGGQPIGAVYHPFKNIVYFAWATTTMVKAYDAGTLTPLAEYDFENPFDHPGNHAFVEGRLKMSRDGRLLFATVQDGIRYLSFNAPPVAYPQSVTTAEDMSIGITLSASDEEDDPLTYIVVNRPAFGVLSGAGPKLTYTPKSNYHGLDQFTFKVDDGLADSSPATVSISVLGVNDPPSFNLDGSNLNVKHNTGLRTIPGWARDISPGPAEEAAQTIIFIVTTNKPGLFLRPPAIDPAGTLSFTPAGRKGQATITVYARDNGGTENGGIDRSVPQIFTITIL